MEIKNKSDFSKLQRLIINQSGLNYRVISLWKDLQHITSFSLKFYAENLPKPKITVLGYKKWSKKYSGMKKRSQTSVFFTLMQHTLKFLTKNKIHNPSKNVHVLLLFSQLFSWSESFAYMNLIFCNL